MARIEWTHLKGSLRRITLSLLLISFSWSVSNGLDIYIQDKGIECDSNISVEVKVRDFVDLYGLQFSIHFDANKLDYQGASYNFPSNAIMGNVSTGVLTFNWFSTNPLSFSDDETIITMDFKLIGDCITPTDLVFSNDPTAIMASTFTEEFVPNTDDGLIFFVNNMCGLDVDAGPDQTVCEPGGTVQLNGSVNSEVLSFSWSPAGPLDNPNSLNPMATVNQTTTFTLEGSGEGPNLIQNWNFEMGNTGFTSEYTYNPNDLTNEGTYAVVPSPAAIHPNFSDCDDHTPGPAENLMVVNGASVANVNVWCQTISVVPDTDYEFSAWVGSVHPVSPAKLQFSINGELLGDVFEASGVPCMWEEFFETWNSGNATSATICIVNQNTALSGNDFALDDISFHAVCTAEDQMTVKVMENSEHSLDTAICEGESIEFNGQQISTEGIHVFTLQAANGCDSILTVDLQVIDPQAVIIPPDPLNCDQDIVTLDGTPSSGGNNLTYQWSTNNGHFVGSNTGPTVQVDEAGIYSLVVRTEQSGISCTSDPFEITVTADTTAPVISIQSPDSLECPPDTVTLQASIDQSQGPVILSWSTADGNILNGFTALDPEVNEAGTYTLTAVHAGNGCTATASVTVEADSATAEAVISSPDTLTCNLQMISLDGSASNPQDASYHWSSPDGNILSDPEASQIDVDQAGTYQLIVSANNSCMDTATVRVIADTMPPDFDLSGPGVLTCNNPRDTIWLKNISSPAASIEVTWTSDPDSAIVQQTGQYIIVKGGGQFYANVVSNKTGCAAIDMYSLAENKDRPQFNFAPVDSLTCTVDTVILTTDLQNSTLDYSWSTVNGSIVSPANQATVSVTTSDYYYLEVHNPANGCTSRDSVFVPESTASVSFDLYASQTELNCEVTEITLSLNDLPDLNDLSITGSGPSGNPIFSGNDTTEVITEGGLYTVSVRDENSGCQAQQTLYIEEDFEAPVASAGSNDTLDCQTTTVILDGSESQGGGLSFQWYPLGDPTNILGTSPTLQVNDEGSFVLLVTNEDNSCTDRDTVDIIEGQDIPYINIDTPAQINCRDSTVVLDASLSDQSPMLSAFWSSPDGTIIGNNSGYDILAGQSGQYVFHLENQANGCTATDTVLVTSDTLSPPASLPEEDSLSCSESMIELELIPETSGDYSYAWESGPNGNILTNPNMKNIIVDREADYTVTLTDESNGCTSKYSTTVTRDTSSPVARAGDDKILPCEPKFTTLNGSGSTGDGSLSYQWSDSSGIPLPNSDTPSIQVQSPGWYVLEVIHERNGCSDVDSVFVERAKADPVQFETGPAQCEKGGSLYLFDDPIHDQSTAVIPSLGTISFGDTLDDLSSGQYLLSVTNQYNCTTDTSFSIASSGELEVDLPVRVDVSAGDSVRLLPDLSIPESEVATVHWEPPQYLDCDSCISPVVRPEETTTYIVEVKDIYGCTGQATIEVRVQRGHSVYIPNAFSPNDDGINDFFTIYGAEHIMRIRAMNIYNRWGDLVYQAEGIAPDSPSAQWDGRFRGKKLQAGVYVYQIDVLLQDGSSRLFRGDVTLIR